MDIEKSSDLMELINSEMMKVEDIDYKKVFLYFINCCSKTISKLDCKFSDCEDIKEPAISMGVEMFYHVFFILVGYSYNLKLTIFLTERAILLYTEFLIMSKNKKMIKELCYNPSINDAISFAYKKTIGCLTINKTLKSNLNLNVIRDCSRLIMALDNNYYYYLVKNSRTLNLVESLDEINNIFNITFYEIFSNTKDNKMLTNFIFNKINYIIAEDVHKHNFIFQCRKKADNAYDKKHTRHNYLDTLLLLKLICENLIILLSKENNYTTVVKIFNCVYDKLCVSYDIEADIDLNKIKNYKKTKSFVELKKSIRLFRKINEPN